MAEQRPARSRPQATLTAAQVEQLLDRIDEALLTGDREQAATLLEQLWPARRLLPELLTQRLSAGRARVPLFAFELLGGTAGRRTPTYLRRIAEDPTVADIVRFGARRRLGWPERGEAKRRLAFLTTLQDPEGTLLEALDQAGMSWPPANELFEEVLGYLAALPAAQRQAVVMRAAGKPGLALAWFLHALLHFPDPALQRLALGELLRLRDPAAAGPVERLMQTTRDTQLRTEAAAMRSRLSLQVVDGGRRTTPLPLPPLERVLLSIIDGDGGQAVLVVRRLGEHALLLADFFLHDSWGVKSVHGLSSMAADQLEERLFDFDEQGVTLLDADLAAARGLLAAALETNAATGRPLPPAFELWEPLLHETYPPPADEPAALPELDDTPYARRDDLIRASSRLLDHPFFETWGFDFLRTAEAMQHVPGPSGSRLTERQYRPLIAQLVEPALRARLRQRLRRQAWLLDRNGDSRARDLALAVAAQLAEGTPGDLARLPFLRRLVQRSVADVLATAFLVEAR
ncbi:MAG TPA: hypothetical protein VFB73_18225 [Chloroflexota bacterium]|nr:hypothetical protein [Chloroflexota bacterium]